jgi:hypothetical protein
MARGAKIFILRGQQICAHHTGAAYIIWSKIPYNLYERHINEYGHHTELYGRHIKLKIHVALFMVLDTSYSISLKNMISNFV